MLSGEAEYIEAVVGCMRANHLRTLGYEIKRMDDKDCNPMNIRYKPSCIIIDNEVVKCTSK